VGDWVGRGLLEVKASGLALKPGTAPQLPDALHALWDQRIRTALGDDEVSWKALELAAVLASTVDLVEWEAAVRDAKLPVEAIDKVVDALAGAGLARRTEDGFAFAHSLVRGSVERRAREAGRLTAHHASAAHALASLWGTDTPAAAARIGRHLLAAGSPTGALQPLLAAARAALEEGDALEAGGLLADWERAKAQLSLHDGDVRVGGGLVLCAQLAHAEGRHDDARALGARAAAVLLEPKQRAAALRVEAAAAVMAGDLRAAEALYSEARATSAGIDDRPGVGSAVRGLGDVAYFRGDKKKAAEHYLEVGRIFKTHGKKTELALNLWNLGYVEMERGDLVAARKYFHDQRALCRACRDRAGEANAENALGELARKHNKLDEAEDHYRKATRLAQRSGLARRWTFRLNQGHVRVLRDDIEGARAVAAELLAQNAAKEPLVASSCWWMLALHAATRKDLAGWEKTSALAVECGTRGVTEEDTLEIARRAGEAMKPVDAQRAERAFAFVRTMRARMTSTTG
jgi:tetratricopeptide (TPR) repeat protein